MNNVLINLSLFKLGWLAVVFSAAAGLPEVGAATAAIIAIIHLSRASNVSNEMTLLFIAGCIGLAWESLLLHAGTLSYPGSSSSLVAPYWIVALWMLFATTLNVGMRWLRRNLFLASLAGAIGGPLSFMAGASAGAVELGDAALLTISAGWAVLLPAVAWIASAYDGYATPERALARAGS